MLLIFDLDDTLIPTTEKFTPIRLSLALTRMISLGLPIAYEKGKELLLGMNEKAYHSKEVLEEFVNRVGGSEIHRNAGWGVLEESLDGIVIAKESWVNDFLRGLNYRKAIVTAGNKRVQEEKIDRFGIERGLFEEIIVAETKKKEVAYEHLKGKFGQFIVVGDRIRDDLSTAKKVGGITIHIRQGRGKVEPRNHPDVDYEIEEIRELTEVLRGIK